MTPELLYKAIIVIFMLFIFGSLTSGLYYLIRDRGTTERTVRALTFRIGLSVFLFVLLLIGMVTGIIKPHGLPQHAPPQTERALR